MEHAAGFRDVGDISHLRMDSAQVLDALMKANRVSCSGIGPRLVVEFDFSPDAKMDHPTDASWARLCMESMAHAVLSAEGVGNTKIG